MPKDKDHDAIRLHMPAGWKQIIQACAKKRGMKVNRWLLDAIRNAIPEPYKEVLPEVRPMGRPKKKEDE